MTVRPTRDVRIWHTMLPSGFHRARSAQRS
jgi:hypothetical protein